MANRKKRKNRPMAVLRGLEVIVSKGREKRHQRRVTRAASTAAARYQLATTLHDDDLPTTGKPSEDRAPAAQRGSKRLAGLLSGPRYVLAAIVTALIGAAAPTAVSWIQDRSGPVVEITAWETPDQRGGDSTFAFERVIPSGMGARSFPDNWNTWAPSNGGVQVETAANKIVVQGRRPGVVSIVGMRAHVLSRSQPIAGTLLFSPPQGPSANVSLGFDLDAPDLTARMVDEDGVLSKRPYFASHQVTVSKGESIAFSVAASTKACDCTWEAVLDLVVEGTRKPWVVRPSNGPFRVTAYARAYGAVYEYDVTNTTPTGNGLVYQDPRVFCASAGSPCARPGRRP